MVRGTGVLTALIAVVILAALCNLVTERRDGIVAVKVVILRAMLALGVIYWLVRDQDAKEARGEN